jgi:oligopeptide/dipeptide ABC transporter ATP-binding protein
MRHELRLMQPGSQAMSEPLLEVDNLHTEFHLGGDIIHAVNGVSFTVPSRTVLGIVGESGSGKSVTALSILRLVEPPGYITSGRVLLHNNGAARDLLTLTDAEMEAIRGVQISMIFQDPMTSLNPVLTIGYQLMEPLRIHRQLPARAAQEAAIQLLDRVGIPEAARRLQDYPHQFSGGMRQRVMIAMAVACTPRLLIADEPTTALDVTIQAQILDLLAELKDELDTSVILITHDLGVVAQLADQVAVMYAGMIVESGPVRAIFRAPQHPYTRALLAAIPRLHYQPDRLVTIEGTPPALSTVPPGCPFEPRCAYRIEKCAQERPLLIELAPGHSCACWVAQEGGLPDA